MGLWSRLKRTWRDDGDREIQEELQFHAEMAAGGQAPLGNVTRVYEETRASGVIEWLDTILTDVRYGLRQLRKTPALVLAVVLSLAIGVGANTAIFSLVDAALLRPLPVPEPDQLRIISWTNHEFPTWVTNINGQYDRLGPNSVRASSVGASLQRRLAQEQTAFTALIGVADSNHVVIGVGGAPAEQVSLQYVSANFFQGLAVIPVIGRPFREDEDRVGQAPVVIVSHRLWTRLGNYDVRINNVPARIVGVAPPGFFGLQAGHWTDIYAPLAARVAFRPQENAAQAEEDGDWWVRQVGRLRPGISETAAMAQLSSLLRNLAPPEGTTADGRKNLAFVGLPGRRGFDALEARESSALWILMLLVAMLLLIVCANVANLLLSRSVGRQRESAVRLALGSGRLRLFRQHLTESTTLALVGGTVGLAFGVLIAQSIHLLFQTGRDASNAFDLQIDPRVLGYTAGLSLLTALLFGLAPAVRASRAAVGDALKAQARSVTGGRLRMPRALVSVQIALSLTALVAAGLLGHSLQKLRLNDIGFDRQNLAYATINPRQAGYTKERIGPYLDRLRGEIARIPGILNVSSVENRLLAGGSNLMRVNLPGQVVPLQKGFVDQRNAVLQNRVADGFFETMRLPVLAGRPIEKHDLKPDADAIVVNETFASRFFPNQNALGRRFGLKQGNDSQYQIVGVVRDTRYYSIREATRPTVFQPLVAEESRGPVHFAIRTSLDSIRLAASVRQAIASVDPAVPLTEFHTQTGLIDRLLRSERLLGFLSIALSAIAVTLAAIGLGGLLAYAVARRTNEIGVRMALGAATGDVISMVLRDSLKMVAAGLLIGLHCAYAIGQLLKTMLFRLEPADPRTIGLSLLFLVAVAVFAAWIPARRAARIDPLTALREE